MTTETSSTQTSRERLPSPVRMVFDPVRALEWVLDEEGLENILESEYFGTEHGLGDLFAADVADVIAELPATVLTLNGCSLAVDGVFDSIYLLVRVHVTLPSGVRIAGVAERAERMLPGFEEYEGGSRDGALSVAGVHLPPDEEFPQINSLIYILARIVAIGNGLIDELYQSLMRVADGRAQYLQRSPDSQRDTLETEVQTLQAAAGAVVGDPNTLRGLLPSWLWDQRLHDGL